MSKSNPQQSSFDDYRSNLFSELSENRSALFNFFFERNRILKFIEPEDYKLLQTKYFQYLNTTANWTAGSLIGMIVVDKLLLPRMAPNFHIPFMRPLVFLAKWVGVPMLGFIVSRNLMVNDVEAAYH